ncbi:DUF4836 family protein [Rapidithrix thailandica]|uniref:DUF4836 family protein n=1 Tax=Rapidithrix thailandica TaxID=413964 RepID=A0AAW9S7Y2_9BACT
MKRSPVTYFSSLCILLVTFFSSCKEERPINTYLPEDASAVMALRSQDLAAKMLFENTSDLKLQKLLPLIKEKETQQAAKDILKALSDPMNSGLNLLADSYIYTRVQAQEWGILLKVSNVEKLSKSLTEKITVPHDLYLKENYKLLVFEKVPLAIAWNEEVLLINGTEKKNHASLENSTNEVLTLSVEKSLMHLPQFAQLQQREADALLFAKSADFDTLTQIDSKKHDLAYLNLLFHFEEGQLKLDFEQHFKEAKPLLKAKTDLSPNLDIWNRLDDTQLVSFFNFHYRKEALLEMAQMYDSTYFQQLNKATGLEQETFFSALNGNMTLACLQSTEETKEVVSYEYDDDFNKIEVKETQKIRQPNLLLEIGTGTPLTNFLNTLADIGLLKKSQPKNYQLQGLNFPVLLQQNEASLFISSNPAFLEDSGEQTSSSDQMKELSKYPVSAFLNFKKLAEDPMFRRTIDQQTSKKLKNLEDISFYAFQEENIIKGKFELNFTTKEENSLKTILQSLPSSQPEEIVDPVDAVEEMEAVSKVADAVEEVATDATEEVEEVIEVVE